MDSSAPRGAAAVPDPASLLSAFVARADIADLALLIWALTMTSLLVWALKELAAANRRFDDFVRELARFNDRAGE